MKKDSVFITLTFLLSFLSILSATKLQSTQAPFLSLMIFQKTQEKTKVTKPVQNPTSSKTEIDNLVNKSFSDKLEIKSNSVKGEVVNNSVTKGVPANKDDKKDVNSKASNLRSVANNDAGKKLILL